MVYLDGDNDLEGAAIEDFLEMSSVGSNEDINIVAQFDRIPGESSGYGNWTSTKRFHILQGMTPHATNAVEDIGEANMGSLTVLLDFIDWATTNYPAKKYALVLWNHGGGWRERMEELEEKLAKEGALLTPKERKVIEEEINRLEAKIIERKGLFKGVCWDETDGMDYLETREVRAALEGVATPIDLIGFDACLMGMLEVAYEIKDEGSVMVGSEKTEPGDGWPYNTILQDLTGSPTMTPAQLGSTIVNRYGESYGGAETQAAIDLSKITNLSNSLSSFCNTVMSINDPEEWLVVHLAKGTSATFSYNYYRDLRTFLQQVYDNSGNASIQAAAQTALTAFDNAIIANHSGSTEGGNGLSIYFTDHGEPMNPDYNLSIIKFAQDTLWDEFIAAYLDKLTIFDENFSSGLPEDWTVVDKNNDGKTWTHTNPGNRFKPKNWETTFMIVDSDWAGIEVEMDEELITPPIDCTGYGTVYLKFEHYFRWYNKSLNEVGDIDVSINGGAWTNVAKYQGNDDDGEKNINISSLASNQSNVRIRWHYYNANYEWFWGIDNVELLGIQGVIEAGSISGIISYTGTKTGTLRYGAFNNPQFQGSPVAEGTTTFTGPDSFAYTLQANPGTYYMASFLDTNSDDKPSISEPVGIYGTLTAVYTPWQIIGIPTSVYVEADSVASNINFVLTHEIPIFRTFSVRLVVYKPKYLKIVL
jgi:hypothetical protein